MITTTRSPCYKCATSFILAKQVHTLSDDFLTLTVGPLGVRPQLCLPALSQVGWWLPPPHPGPLPADTCTDAEVYACSMCALVHCVHDPCTLCMLHMCEVCTWCACSMCACDVVLASCAAAERCAHWLFIHSSPIIHVAQRDALGALFLFVS